MYPTNVFGATISINGQNIPVIKFSFKENRDTELVHVNQPDPIGKLKGKRNYSGEMTVLLYDALRIEASVPQVNGSRHIDELNFDVVYVQNFGTGGIVSKSYVNCSITEFNIDVADGNAEVVLPVVFTKILG